MKKKIKQLIVLNEKGDKILTHSAIRFEPIDGEFKKATKHWHLRSYLFDNKADVEKTLSWIRHYSKDYAINMHNKLKCEQMLKEGFVIKEVTIEYNFPI